MSIFIYLIIFCFGLIIGSFLNVVILRLHYGGSIVVGRSKCPDCGRVLNWLDLFPVFSYIILKGKCRYCQKKISWQYPAIELATACLFVAVAYLNYSAFGDLNLLRFIRDFLAISALIVIFVYDLRWMIIPDSVAIPAAVIILIINIFLGYPIILLLVGVVVGLGFFGLQYVISKGAWIGGGDLRLGALMGALLGWPLIIVALFFSYIVGAAVALWLLANKKVTPKSAIPFGVFLVPATIFVLFFGEKIFNWYWGIM